MAVVYAGRSTHDACQLRPTSLYAASTSGDTYFKFCTNISLNSTIRTAVGMCIMLTGGNIAAMTAVTTAPSTSVALIACQLSNA